MKRQIPKQFTREPDERIRNARAPAIDIHISVPGEPEVAAELAAGKRVARLSNEANPSEGVDAAVLITG